jgi:hypothetical protein|tara:strand:- start:279 stop:572 length:294 start_codon:yes stop_codon:yes gene_type:complete
MNEEDTETVEEDIEISELRKVGRQIGKNPMIMYGALVIMFILLAFLVGKQTGYAEGYTYVKEWYEERLLYCVCPDVGDSRNLPIWLPIEPINITVVE